MTDRVRCESAVQELLLSEDFLCEHGQQAAENAAQSLGLTLYQFCVLTNMGSKRARRAFCQALIDEAEWVVVSSMH